MPGAAIVAGALQDLTVPARVKSLWIAGRDVLMEPGKTGMGVPLGSIEVRESGPGGVSSMSFVINDPGMTVSLNDGDEVQYHDHLLDEPIFRGFLQGFSARPGLTDGTGLGRTWTVECIGIEAVLDWAKTTLALTFPASPNGGESSPQVAAQSIVANSIGLGPIRAGSSLATGYGNQEYPVEPINGASNPEQVTIPAGTTVREAIRTITEANYIGAGLFTAPNISVDFHYGLRIWQDPAPPQTLFMPDDYTADTITDTHASAAVAEPIAYDRDAVDVVRGVVFVGTGVIVTASDGSGKLGDIATVFDSDVTTAAYALTRARAYLQAFNRAARGSYTRRDRTSSATIHGGSVVAITDAQLGLSAAEFRILEIVKTFNASGRENWTVAFGGRPPSLAAEARRLTRDTLS